MRNIVLKNRGNFEERNYVLKTLSANDYWFGLYYNKTQSFERKYGDDFNLIIAGDEDVENDFYIIPYGLIKPVLKRKYFSGKGKRWVGSIVNHKLRIANHPFLIDIRDCYGRIVDAYEKRMPTDNYNVINIQKPEPNQEQDILTFRKLVLNNFENKCCLSEVEEQEMLVASPIIPLDKGSDTGFAPSNGLCFFVTYDKLFSEGYFTVGDDFRIIVVRNLNRYSFHMRFILKTIVNKIIRKPVDHEIAKENLLYHNSNIFRG